MSAPISLTRRNNVLFLLEEKGISRHELCNMISMKYSLLGSYLSPNAKKNIGNSTASRFEKAFGLKSGELDTNITKKHFVGNSESTNPPKNTQVLKNEIIDQLILVIPLFISDLDNGALNPSNEPYIEKTFLKVDTVLDEGINPNNVVAIKIKDNHPIPHKKIIYVDLSITTFDHVNPKNYLVAINGKRQVIRFPLDQKDLDIKILGHAFYIEHPFFVAG